MTGKRGHGRYGVALVLCLVAVVTSGLRDTTPGGYRGTVETMVLRELVGQLIMIGFDGKNYPDRGSAALMREYRIGGLILFGRNTKDFEQTRILLGEMEKINADTGLPLFIGIDVEGGEVSRFRWQPALLSAGELGRMGDADAAYRQALRIGTSLSGCGINIDFSPVLDVAPDPAATFLGERIFGSSVELVSEMGRQTIAGLRAGGVIPAAKHFPGHGGTSLDSHDEQPVVHRSLSQLLEYDLMPFQSAIDYGVEIVMVGHLVYPALDPEHPASVSPEIIGGLLRSRMKYDGIVISDDMRMKAVSDHYPSGEAAVRFIEAGGDIVLIGREPERQREICAALLAAAESGRLSRKRLEESVNRIVRLKFHNQLAQQLNQNR